MPLFRFCAWARSISSARRSPGPGTDALARRFTPARQLAFARAHREPPHHIRPIRRRRRPGPAHLHRPTPSRAVPRTAPLCTVHAHARSLRRGGACTALYAMYWTGDAPHACTYVHSACLHVLFCTPAQSEPPAPSFPAHTHGRTDAWAHARRHSLHACTRARLHSRAHTHARTYTPTQTLTHSRTCMSMHMCIDMRMQNIYICTYLLRVHTVHARARAHAHTRTHTHTHAHTRTRARARAHKCQYACYIHVCTHVCTHVCPHTCAHA